MAAFARSPSYRAVRRRIRFGRPSYGGASGRKSSHAIKIPRTSARRGQRLNATGPSRGVQRVSGSYYDGRLFREGTVGWEDDVVVEVRSARARTPLAEGLIVPGLWNAHTHLGDAIVTQELKGTLEELVAPPHGLKHRVLAKAKDAAVIAAMRRAMATMVRTGTTGFADFREGGLKGLKLLYAAVAAVPIQGIALGRPAELSYDPREVAAILRASDGIAVSSYIDWPRHAIEKLAADVRREEDLRDPLLRTSARRHRNGPRLEARIPRPHGPGDGRGLRAVRRRRRPDRRMSALERVLRVDTGHSAHARARHRAPSGDGQRDDQHAVPPARDGIRVSSRPDERRRAGARDLRDGAARTSSLRSGGSIRDSRRCAGRPRHPRSPGRAERVCFPRARLRERCPTRRLGRTIVARTGSVGPGRIDDPGTPAQRRTPDPMKRPRPTPSFILRRHFLAPMGSYDDVMSLSVRRGFLWPSVDLYGGFAGFYDYGHNGVLMRRRWEDLWTETFLGLSDNYYLIDTTTILPEAPLKASGHVDHFSDLLVTCTRCGESYRGDQLLEAATHEEHEGLTPAELDARIRELKIRCPNCKGELGPARPFNMMFLLDVGPTGKDRAYLGRRLPRAST